MVKIYRVMVGIGSYFPGLRSELQVSCIPLPQFLYLAIDEIAMATFVTRKTVGAWCIQNVRSCRRHLPPCILIGFEKGGGQLLDPIDLTERTNLVDIDLGVRFEVTIGPGPFPGVPSVVPTTLTAIRSVGFFGSVNVNVADSGSQSHRANCPYCSRNRLFFSINSWVRG